MSTATSEAAPAEAQFAIVELFGHQRIAGRISDHTLGGSSFVRVDVPSVRGQPAYTRLFGGNAIYGISFVEERIATAMAEQLRVVPVQTYELPQMLGAPDRTSGIRSMDPDVADPAF